MISYEKRELAGQGPAVSFADAEFAWTNRRNPRNLFRHFWMGGTRANDGFDSKTKARAHVSQKPVNLMAWCIGPLEKPQPRLPR